MDKVVVSNSIFATWWGHPIFSTLLNVVDFGVVSSHIHTNHHMQSFGLSLPSVTESMCKTILVLNSELHPHHCKGNI